MSVKEKCDDLMSNRLASWLQEMSGSHDVPIEKRIGRLREASGDVNGAGLGESSGQRKAG